MTERLLQFIWQFQYFNRKDLFTEQGDPLQIVHAGTLNVDQGPDFTGARVRIGDTTWAGNIEIHLLSSDWGRHLHHTDPNYKNIILHVVWKNDDDGSKNTPAGVPTLELEPRVSALLLVRYDQLLNSAHFVPCESSLHQVSRLVWTSWKERLAIERLERKSAYVLELFRQSNHHWEETFWWLLARNFGIRVNTEAFEAIARSLPLNIIARHRNHPAQVEALLFGQAGLLERRFTESYPQLLQKEFRFLKKKYDLKKVFVSLQFLRMRPSSFPSIRLAQLAVLLQGASHLFSSIRDIVHLDEITSLFAIRAGDYWNTHYSFEEKSPYAKKHLGKDMTAIVMINAVIPVVFACGLYQHDQALKERAIGWLGELASENNRILRGWVSLGATNECAADSQALLELKMQYCDSRRCLSCAIGNYILKGKE